MYVRVFVPCVRLITGFNCHSLTVVEVPCCNRIGERETINASGWGSTYFPGILDFPFFYFFGRFPSLFVSILVLSGYELDMNLAS